MLTQNILMENNIAEIKISYSQPVATKDRIAMTTDKKVVEVLRYVWDDRTIELFESFKVILLNRNMRLLGVASLSEGGITGTVADIRLIFAIALKAAAVSIILAHNHPSGNTQPSETDKYLTQKVMKCGSILDIELMDHIILTKDSYYSFREHGIMDLN